MNEEREDGIVIPQCREHRRCQVVKLNLVRLLEDENHLNVLTGAGATPNPELGITDVLREGLLGVSHHVFGILPAYAVPGRMFLKCFVPQEEEHRNIL